MILTGQKILEEYSKWDIIIEPFLHENINPNSYNYRLGDLIKAYNPDTLEFDSIIIPEEWLVLEPWVMYLWSTYETLWSKKYAMSLIWRSSLGRLGLFLQVSANLWHTWSIHSWTLELVACKPIRIYPRMKIWQISFWRNYWIKYKSHKPYYSNFSSPTESKLNKVYDTNLRQNHQRSE